MYTTHSSMMHIYASSIDPLDAVQCIYFANSNLTVIHNPKKGSV